LRHRCRQLDALEPVAQKIENPLAIGRALEPFEALHGRCATRVPEDELELSNLRVTHFELVRETRDRLRHRFDEHGHARALVDEIDLVTDVARRLETVAKIGPSADGLVELLEARLARPA